MYCATLCTGIKILRCHPAPHQSNLIKNLSAQHQSETLTQNVSISTLKQTCFENVPEKVHNRSEEIIDEAKLGHCRSRTEA